MEPVFNVGNIRAIIGLGNPGPSYAKHRHSIGFRIVDTLADRLAAVWRANDTMNYASALMQADATSHEIFLIKPLTFMNNSGRVISWILKKGIKPDQILVIHDELEKPFGQSLIKFGGSHKGHNGLKSIMGAIGPDFWHLKFGIGRPADKDMVPDYVLSNFSKDEEARVPELIDQSLNLIIT